MNRINFSKKIANLIVDNDLGTALDILEETLAKENASLHKEIILLKRRYNELEHKDRMQLSPNSEIQIEKNKISIALLEINQKFGIQKDAGESIYISKKNLKHLSSKLEVSAKKYYLSILGTVLSIILMIILIFNKMDYDNELTSIKAYYSQIENYIDDSKNKIEWFTTKLEENNKEIRQLINQENGSLNILKEQSDLIAEIKDETSQLYSKVKENREDARQGLDERINDEVGW